MKRILAVLVLASLAITLSGCSMAPDPLTGASPQNNFTKVIKAVISGKVAISDDQIRAITVGGRGIAEILLDSQAPGLGALLNLLIDGKQIRKSGYLLTVTPEGTKVPIEVICKADMADMCADYPPNVPVVLYATKIPLKAPDSQPVWLLRDISPKPKPNV